MTDLPMRHCALERCGTLFQPRNKRHKYCTEEHRREAQNDRKKAQTIKPLDEMLADMEQSDISRENARQLKRILGAEQRVQRYLTVLREACLSYEPTPLVIKPGAKHAERPEHEWIFVTSDWHTGQRTTIEETGGIYEHSISTVRGQVAKMWSALESIHDVESKGRNITKLNLLGIGDFVDHDDMRPSQHREVEDVISVQTVEAFDLLVWLVRQALTRFPEVEVDLIGGNHDRWTRMKGNAGLGELSYKDTVAWLLGAFMQRTLAPDIESGRLKVRNWETFFGYKRVNDIKVVFEHGSSIKWNANSYGGIPWYGVSQLGPKYDAMLGGADLVCIGHGHRASILPNGRNWLVTNGALPATSTYVQSGMKAVQRPLQWLIDTHAEHGITGFHPLYADVPEALMPGMIWDDPEHYAGLASVSELDWTPPAPR